MINLDSKKEYHSVGELVRDVFGASVYIANITGVQGGDINEAYRVSLSSGDLIFVKTNSIENADFFRKESDGLLALRHAGKIGVPHIMGTGIDREQGYSFLALEYIEGSARVNTYWETFGHQLAELHRAGCPVFLKEKKTVAIEGKQDGNSGRESGVRYGFPEDNYIGASAQKNHPGEKWVEFYRDCRLLPQITMAERYFDPDMRKKAEYLLDHLDSYLREPEFPSLLHGDLWSGNMLTGPDGKAWIIDPAVYVGDFETDLAMTQLFGSLPERFYDAYSEINPIDKKGYGVRRKLYDLYHLLNHLNLFGRTYLRSVVEIIEEYSVKIR